jgi:hypothetical protein
VRFLTRDLYFLISSRRVVIFDEENLATNEVIKEEVRRCYLPFVIVFVAGLTCCPLPFRNMVVKINEPKTPFHYETNEEADEDEVLRFQVSCVIDSHRLIDSHCLIFSRVTSIACLQEAVKQLQLSAPTNYTMHWRLCLPFSR